MAEKTYPVRMDELVDYGPGASGKRWGIDVFLHEGSGGRKRRRFRTKQEAVAKRDELRGQKGLGAGASLSVGSKMSFATLFGEFMRSPRITKTSERNRSDLEEVWRNLVHPHWHLRMIDRATYQDVSRWAGDIRPGHKLGHKRQLDAIKLLTRLFGFAVGEGYLPRNPAFRPGGSRDYLPAQPVKTESEARHALTGRQLRRLMRADPLASGWVDVVLFAGTTGLRFQEWSRLEVADIDVRRQTVSVTKALSTVRGKGHSFRGRAGLIDAPTKNHEARTLPVLPEVLKLLEPRLKARGDALLFGIKGKPVAQTTFAKAMRDGSDRAGRCIARLQENHGLDASGYVDAGTVSAVPACDLEAWGLVEGDEDFRPLTPHGLRHTAISALINSGVPPTAVQKWAGHKDLTTTLNTYSHLYSEDLSKALEAQAAWLAK